MYLKLPEVKPNIRMIIAGGFADPVQKTTFMEAGIDKFIQKPTIRRLS